MKTVASSEAARPAGPVINEAYELVDVGKIKPHPRNPRRGDLDALKDSVYANGFYGACVVQRSTGHILAGNHRFLAGKARGMKAVPVIWVDVDDDRALRILLADNRTADLADYDNAALAELLRDVEQGSGSYIGTGFDGAAVNELLESLGIETNLPGDGKNNGRPAAQRGKKTLTAGLSYRVVVDCESEDHQAELLERFEGEGLKCRPLIS